MKSFSDRVIEAVLTIPKGKVTTYGRLARACGGGAMASQSITTILAKAVKEKGVDIPFHRIVYADGHVWLDDKHKQKRLNLYKKEGIKLDTNNKIKDFADKLWEFL
jgi:alkylated DNA nucleotide flippase Atl1